MLEKGFQLVTLGGLTLCPPSGRAIEGLDDLNARRRKVALLALLALRRRSVSRDILLEMFWGGQDDVRARHSLSDAISHLRRVLGRDAIVATRSELSLAADAPLVLDAHQFAERAAQPGQRLQAIAMYNGRFMEGVHVAQSSSFESWLSKEQTRFERMFVTACELECAALLASDAVGECTHVAERWLDVEPLSARAALTLFDALTRLGTADGDAHALGAYERLRCRLAREYDVAPHDAVARRAEEIAAAMRARRPASPSVVAEQTTKSQQTESDASVDPPRPEAGIVPSTAPVEPPWRHRLWLGAAAALLLVGVWGAVGAYRAGNAAILPQRPVLVVTQMLPPSSDTATQWLVDALPQMISSKLVRSADVEVVSPVQLRAMRARSQTVGESLSADALRDLGRRAGATLVVNGAFLQRDRVIVLDLRLLDVRTGRSTRLETVADSSVLAVVDRAAVRLLSAVGANTEGPRFAEIETASLAAYQHFVRSHQIAYDHPAEAVAELDAAIALDSSFTSAVLNRAIQAIAENDGAMVARLSDLLQRNAPRMAERDRLEWESRVSFMHGDVDRSEALARLLVQRYPRDPRGYHLLSMVYDGIGRWDELEHLLGKVLALDSLGMEGGRGPCISCFGLGQLTAVRLFRADWAGAEQVARRWTALTPEMQAAWINLAMAQSYHGNYAEAFGSVRRALALAPDEPYVLLVSAWLQLMSRNLDGAEAEIAKWEKSGSRTLRMQALDVRAMLQRERGQYRAANATLQRVVAEYPETYWLELERADGLVRVGKCDEAMALIETMHFQKKMIADPDPGGASRAFAWHHTLLADNIVRAGNCSAASTPTLEALADSIERIARRSYYGRDWTLHHHVRGLIAKRQGDYALAEEELRKAQWRIGDSWTRSMAELGLVQLARGRAADALTSFRHAYATRPDAMGRYQPRSELDLYMAMAFRQTGALDSAAVYEGYVRRAWVKADPEVKELLRAFTTAQ